MVKPNGKTSADDHGDSRPDGEQETEDRILDAAHAVFMRRGTAGARMREIAEAAGVNPALLHYYFRSKARLAEAVFKRAAQRLLPPVVSIMASESPLEEKVRRVVERELDVLSVTPGLPAYIIAEMHHHPDRLEQFIASMMGAAPREFAPRILAKLGEQIEERVGHGEMRPISPEQFLVNLISLCIFPFAARPLLTAVFGGSDGFDRLIEERRRSLPDFFLNALRP